MLLDKIAARRDAQLISAFLVCFILAFGLSAMVTSFFTHAALGILFGGLTGSIGLGVLAVRSYRKQIETTDRTTAPDTGLQMLVNWLGGTFLSNMGLSVLGLHGHGLAFLAVFLGGLASLSLAIMSRRNIKAQPRPSAEQ